MKNSEARKTLGLAPEDKPSAFLSDFDETREYKQELINNAPSEELKFRYQQELLEYEAALRVVVGKQKLRPNTDFIVVLLLICSLCTAGWWGYQWHQNEWYVEMKVKSDISELRAAGLSAVTARQWAKAEEAYRQIEALSPGSQLAANGFLAIEKGKVEERNQQIFYTLGESQAALEAGRWDEATDLAKSVIAIAPENEIAQRKLLIIIRERKKQELWVMMSAVSDAIDSGDMASAKKALATLRQRDPKNANISIFADSIKSQEYEISDAA